MKFAVPILLLIVLIVGHAIGLQWSSRREVEQKLVNNAEVALRETGVVKSQVTVTADHRDVRLSGATTQNVDEVKELVRKALATGKTRLTSNIELEDPTPRVALSQPSLKLERRNGLIAVSGSLPNEDFLSEVVSVLKTWEPDVSIENSLSIGDNLASPGWLTEFGYWWPRLQQLKPDLTFNISDRTLRLFGQAANKVEVDTVEKSLVKSVGDDVEVDVTGFSPPKSPPRLELRRLKNGTAELVGELPGENYRKAIIAALKKAEPKIQISDKATVGPYLEEPAWLKNFGKWWPQLEGEVPGAGFSMVQNKLTITGAAATKDSKGKLASLLPQHLDKGASINSEGMTAPVLVMPEVTIKRTGNLIAVSGKVPQASLQKIVGSVNATKGSSNVEAAQLKAGDNLLSADWVNGFENWWPSVIEQVPDATLVASAAGMTVTGNAARENSENEVRKLVDRFSDSFGKNQIKLEINPMDYPKLVVSGDKKALKIEGTVGNGSEKQKLVDGLGEKGAKVDASGLAVGNRTLPAKWSSSLGGYVSNLVDELGQVKLEIVGNRANIAAEIPEKAREKAILADLGMILGERYNLKGDLTLVAMAKPEPPKEPTVAMNATDPKPTTPKEPVVAMNTDPKPDNKPAMTPPKETKPAETKPPKKEEKPMVVAKAETKAPAPTPDKKPEPVKKAEEVAEKTSFYFGKNSSYLPAEEKAKLAEFSKALNAKSQKGYQLVLIGHADYRGDGDYNEWLSERRAKRVLDTLKADGFDGISNTEIRALGETNAASAKAGEAAWRQDRRVDVLIIEK